MAFKVKETKQLEKKDSLRERKKALTRSQLIEVADRLFTTQGYERTILEQIADEVKISLRTLLRYFDSKCQLALAGHYDVLNAFCEEIEDPARGIDTVACWRNWVSYGSGLVYSKERAYAKHMRFIYKEPLLSAGMLKIQQQYEDVMAVGLATDAGIAPAKDLYGRLLSAMLIAGHFATIRHWVESGAKDNLTEICLAVVDFALENFPDRASTKKLGTKKKA